MEYFKRLFTENPDAKFIETDTFRLCKYIVPYCPSKFYIDTNGLIRCYPNVEHVDSDELPLLRYYDRNLVLHTITTTRNMFYECKQLKSIDSSKWNLSHVKNMVQMFYGCSNLERVNVITWDMSSVTHMTQMFYGCSKLRKLYVDNWNVSNVTHMSEAFSGCSGIQKLDASKWNTSKVIGKSHIFDNCDKAIKPGN